MYYEMQFVRYVFNAILQKYNRKIVYLHILENYKIYTCDNLELSVYRDLHYLYFD